MNNFKINGLIECPFCGHNPVAVWVCGCETDTSQPCTDKMGKFLEKVQCTNCSANTSSIEHWNNPAHNTYEKE